MAIQKIQKACRRHRSLRILPKALLLAAVAVFSVNGAAAGPTPPAPNDVRQTVEQEITLRKQMQKREDQWAEKKQALMARYEALENEIETLEAQKASLEARLALRRQKVSQMEQTVTESERVKKELQSTLEAILGRLEGFVAADLPFLPEERSDRIKAVKTCLIDPDVGLSEKTRRTLEALQVELDYGRRLEVTEGQVEIEGRRVAVDLLRVGRLSLFCRTDDGSLTGWYVPAEESWRSLPAEYDAPISEAMEMARQRRPVDMIRLPLGRLEVR